MKASFHTTHVTTIDNVGLTGTGDVVSRAEVYAGAIENTANTTDTSEGLEKKDVRVIDLESEVGKIRKELEEVKSSQKEFEKLGIDIFEDNFKLDQLKLSATTRMRLGSLKKLRKSFKAHKESEGFEAKMMALSVVLIVLGAVFAPPLGAFGVAAYLFFSVAWTAAGSRLENEESEMYTAGFDNANGEPIDDWKKSIRSEYNALATKLESELKAKLQFI